MTVNTIDEKYNKICEKLGFIPSELKTNYSEYENDSIPNPFSILETEELCYLFDNGYLKDKPLMKE